MRLSNHRGMTVNVEFLLTRHPKLFLGHKARIKSFCRCHIFTAFRCRTWNIHPVSAIKRIRHKLPNQLSGGQQQRVSIGRAIVKNPDILLCDEPTGALDYNTSKEILKLIEEINARYHNTVIMVTHNEAIKDMSDHVIRLRDGVVRHDERNTNRVPASELEW